MKIEPSQLEALLSSRYAASRGCERDVELARYVARDLEPDERAAFEAHLAQCAECRADLQSYDASAKAWVAAPQLSLMGRLLGQLLRPRMLGGLAVAAVATLVLVLAVPRADRSDSALHPKGGFALRVAARRGSQTFRVLDGAHLDTGDALGFFYTSGAPGHLLVLYLDRQGALERIFPAGSARSASIEAGTEVPLPDGAVLSPGKGCEWVLAFFSRTPISGENAEAAARRMLDHREGCTLGPASLPGVDVHVHRIER